MPYSTRDTIKEWLNIPSATTDEDSAIDAALAAADAQIDNWTGRTFTVPGSASTRVMVPLTATKVRLPADLDRSTGIVVKTDTTDDGTFDETLTAADWFLLEDQAPFRTIVRRTGYWPQHRSGRPSVQVEGFYGYDSAGVPAPVVQASTMLAARLYQRQSSPLGFQAGVGGDFGAIRIGRGLDPDVAGLLAQYKKAGIG